MKLAMRAGARLFARVSREKTIACLKHVPYEGPALFSDWAHANGWSIECFNAWERSLPASLDDYGILLVMGGPQGVKERTEIDWLYPELELIRANLAAEKPTLGICLGAQFIAYVLGGDVVSSPEREHGWFPVQFADGPQTVFHFHQDAYELPDGARSIASSEGCPNQGFVYGDRVLGLQFHLEMDVETVEGLMEHSGYKLERFGTQRFVQTPEQIREGYKHIDPCRARMERLLADLKLP
ncbi:MAG: type 1 glutamine amidotransferase [Opitutales bacterium]